MLETKIFFEAIEDLEKKGIDKEVTIQALKETFEQIIKKKNYEDCRVQVDIVPEESRIDIFTIKSVVEEVTDDALEIELEDALEVNPTCKIGDDLYQKVELDDIPKSDISKFRSILRQKMKEAEKKAIYEAYADKKGELIPGTVEKIEPTFTCINIGKVTVVLPNKHKIGDEKFEIGQIVKVHLAEVNSETAGPELHVSRADEGFLMRLFEEEIHEIFDGTVTIKGIAREAGERSKVSVISNVENVDPVGACIGNGGTKIKKICDQICNEKIDIIKYSDNAALFIAEALKPATVIGIHLDEAEKKAVAVVKDGDLRVAIGRKGINVVLAVRLTGWRIDIKEVTTALNEGIVYDTLATIQAKAEREQIMSSLNNVTEPEELEEAEEDVTVSEEATVEETVPSEEVKENTVEEAKPEEEIAPAKAEKETPAPAVKEEEKEEVKFEEQKVEIVNTSKISLAELEAQIDADKKKQSQPARTYKKRQDKTEENDEKEDVVKKNPNNYMAVEYTEEELEEIENDEEENNYDDDTDYSEYDKFYEE